MRPAAVHARRPIATGIAACVLVVLALGAVTLVALEGREVVVLHTRAVDGRERATRAWIADADGAAWVEAANPDRPFLHDLERVPELVLERSGRRRHCRTRLAANPDGHVRIRELLAAKYGWADCWIALVADTRHSLAVRLDCEDGLAGATARRSSDTRRGA